MINKLQTIADRVYDEYGSIIFQRRGRTLRLERHSSDWSLDGVRFDKIAPLQIFRRGGMTTMTGDDIVTRQHLTRFDMEIGAGVAEGMEDQIGLLSDTNFEVPSL